MVRSAVSTGARTSVIGRGRLFSGISKNEVAICDLHKKLCTEPENPPKPSLKF